MPILHNDKPRLMWGPKVPGFKAQAWKPGMNRIETKYWDHAKKHGMIKKWIELGFIRIDLEGTMPDPNTPPSAGQLAKFTPTELEAALKNPDVPISWHSHIKSELAARSGMVTEAQPVVEKEIIPPAAPPAPSASPESLSEYTVKEAAGIIAIEEDVDLLLAWAKEDTRKGIDAAVDARLTELAEDGG